MKLCKVTQGDSGSTNSAPSSSSSAGSKCQGRWFGFVVLVGALNRAGRALPHEHCCGAAELRERLPPVVTRLVTTAAAFAATEEERLRLTTAV
ncbi:hypothetical protein DdX_07962 [Ditylenchus destructor]|uniref:Uncharacterized protein n=1 Tax=Ditylenchus destructor TaxID=166010 RepID=A0AAD4N5K4_9BILA|nr:hypothetical protein DdX_07962 [Ditylenchus destructor]